MSRAAGGGSDIERALLAWVTRRSDSIVVLAARTVLLARRDALYDMAVQAADSALRGAAVARAQGVEESVELIERLLRP